jgi:molybdopterin-guanine dinucleotide biosynthesis protein A
MSTSTPRTAGVVLAGGRATRLGGGDKPFRTIAGRPMLDHVVERLSPQVDAVAINANGDPSRFAGYGLPVVADQIVPGRDVQAGPLSGILAAMRWAASAGAGTVLTVAGDTPFFPHDLATRLRQAAGDRAGVAVATSGGRIHPVFALWPVGLEAALARFLDESATYSVMAFLREHEAISVDFPMTSVGETALDPFFNVNTPDDLRAAETVATGPAS